VRKGQATTPIGKQRPAAEFAWPPTNGTTSAAASIGAASAAVSP
jgi:penicillin-binding protein 2